MKKQTLLMAGMLAIALTFGLVLASCGDADGGENTDAKELVISNLDKDTAKRTAQAYKENKGEYNYDGMVVRLFPTNVGKTEAEKTTGYFAASSPSTYSVNIFDSSTPPVYLHDLSDQTNINPMKEPLSAKAYLIANRKAWTGTGTYYVFLVDGDSTNGFCKVSKNAVSFTKKETKLDFTNDFEAAQ